VASDLWKQQAYESLKEQEIVFFGYRSLLTGKQGKLLKAIAQEGKVFKPTSQDFLGRYGLLNSASVLRSLQPFYLFGAYFQDVPITYVIQAIRSSTVGMLIRPDYSVAYAISDSLFGPFERIGFF
jgi:hypothetical protein